MREELVSVRAENISMAGKHLDVGTFKCVWEKARAWWRPWSKVRYGIDTEVVRYRGAWWYASSGAKLPDRDQSLFDAAVEEARVRELVREWRDEERKAEGVTS